MTWLAGWLDLWIHKVINSLAVSFSAIGVSSKGSLNF
jgi:hypothetical protein